MFLGVLRISGIFRSFGVLVPWKSFQEFLRNFRSLQKFPGIFRNISGISAI
jgi:hypothetical protein